MVKNIKDIGNLELEKTLPTYFISMYEEAIEKLEEQIDRYKERVEVLKEAEREEELTEHKK